MSVKSKAFSVLGRVTWKVLAVFGSKWAKNKLAGSSRPKHRPPTR